jgi:hypothetical protein
MIIAAHALALTLLLAPFAQARSVTLETEARALIGVTYCGERFTEASRCTDMGGGLLLLDGRVSHEWSFAEVLCGNGIVLLLTRLVAMEDNRLPVWRVVDAVPLPRFKLDWTSRDVHHVGMFMNGDCQVDARIDNSLVVLARLGKRNRVDRGGPGNLNTAMSGDSAS